MKTDKLIKMMSTMLIGVFMVGTVMAAPQGGQNRGPDGAGNGPDMDEPPVMIEALSLTDAQIQTLKKNKISKQREMIKLRSGLEEARLDLAEAMMDNKPNRGKIEKIAARIGKLEEKKVLQHADSLIELKSVLTEEQLQKLDSMMMLRGGPEGGFGHEMGMKPGKKGKKKGRGMGRF